MVRPLFDDLRGLGLHFDGRLLRKGTSPFLALRKPKELCLGGSKPQNNRAHGILRSLGTSILPHPQRYEKRDRAGGAVP